MRALSFEFTIIAGSLAAHYLARCDELGPYSFNAALGKTQRLVFIDWGDVETMARWFRRCRTAPTLAIFMLSPEGAASGFLRSGLEDDLTGVGMLRRVRNPFGVTDHDAVLPELPDKPRS